MQNLFISLGVIVLLVVATVTGLVGIGPAVVVHEGSTLLVIANALRLLVYGDRDTTRERSVAPRSTSGHAVPAAVTP